MNFFETELKKMTAKVTLMKNPRLVGRACIARLTDKTTVKTEFATDRVANHYPAIRITVLNRTEIWSYKEEIHAWADYGKTEWYGYHPTTADYTKIAKAISDYLENFAD